MDAFKSIVSRQKCFGQVCLLKFDSCVRRFVQEKFGDGAPAFDFSLYQGHPIEDPTPKG